MSTREELASQIAASLVNTVHQLDGEFDFSNVLQSVTITCEGPGRFSVEMTTVEGVDTTQVKQEIEDTIKGDKREQDS